MSKNDLLTVAQKVLFIQPKTPSIQELKSILLQNNYKIVDCDIINPYCINKILIEESPSAILIDISIFQELIACYTIVKAIKKYSSIAKIVFLTHAMDNYVLEMARDCCASAYILKPCKPYEVLVTLELLLGIEKKEFTNSFSLAYGYFYNIKRKQLFKDEVEILLSKNGQKLIELLVKNRGCTVSFEQILYHIWNKNYSLGALRSLVYRINRQIGVLLIENVKGVGYRVD